MSWVYYINKRINKKAMVEPMTTRHLSGRLGLADRRSLLCEASPGGGWMPPSYSTPSICSPHSPLQTPSHLFVIKEETQPPLNKSRTAPWLSHHLTAPTQVTSSRYRARQSIKLGQGGLFLGHKFHSICNCVVITLTTISIRLTTTPTD